MRAIPSIAITRAKQLEELVLRVYDDRHPQIVTSGSASVSNQITQG